MPRFACLAVLVVLGISLPNLAWPQAPNVLTEQRGYVPHLSEIMSTLQSRHIKLWFAGKSRNWELATYELQQIDQSFSDAGSFYPGIPVADMTPLTEPAREIGEAIGAKDSAKFAAAFNHLTTACNGCHQAIGRGFIVVQVPAASPFSDQSFAPKAGH
ncbi:hypothetical protein [Bradyrhizobium sp. dw_78]|uniref:hypothetical protein n=1 Tax=Bradyrhizobium sp. dw_78 TaxID=2719793 RepID=UPI00201C25BF|nr:hypothetical protein [Bradyrhizobium sp. dw_78]